MMKDPAALANQVEGVFRRIHHERMAGLPLLNPALQVQTLGFQLHKGRILGVLITPWMMSFVLFPAAGDDWSGLELGAIQTQSFPSGDYQFLVNAFDEVGLCQGYSLFSPMGEFPNQASAQAAAQTLLIRMMTPRPPEAQPADNHNLLGRVLRGEATPELDGSLMEEGTLPISAHSPVPTDAPLGFKPTVMTRRDLLRGWFGEV